MGKIFGCYSYLKSQYHLTEDISEINAPWIKRYVFFLMSIGNPIWLPLGSC